MLETGQVVYSKCGRDKGLPFIVTAIDDDVNYIYLVDGDVRPLAKPKKKKVKHLQPVSCVYDEIKRKLDGNLYLLDAEIRNALEKHKR